MNNTAVPIAPRPVRTFKTPPGGSLYEQNPGLVAVITAVLLSVFLWLAIQLIGVQTPDPVIAAPTPIVVPTPVPTLTVLCVLTTNGWVVSAYDEYGFGAVVTNTSPVRGLDRCLDYMD